MSLISSYTGGSGKIVLKTDMDYCEMENEQAAHLGMIVNELITNALKYAFPGCDSGTVEMILRQYEESFLLQISDDGCGLPAGFTMENSQGLGMGLVAMMAEQMSGTVTLGNLDKTVFSIYVPKHHST